MLLPGTANTAPSGAIAASTRTDVPEWTDPMLATPVDDPSDAIARLEQPG
jgi:hypothetical protein